MISSWHENFFQLTSISIITRYVIVYHPPDWNFKRTFFRMGSDFQGRFSWEVFPQTLMKVNNVSENLCFGLLLLYISLFCIERVIMLLKVMVLMYVGIYHYINHNNPLLYLRWKKHHVWWVSLASIKSFFLQTRSLLPSDVLDPWLWIGRIRLVDLCVLRPYVNVSWGSVFFY